MPLLSSGCETPPFTVDTTFNKTDVAQRTESFVLFFLNDNKCTLRMLKKTVLE